MDSEAVYKIEDYKETKILGNYYVKLYRVADKGKRTYSKIVTKEKADRLLSGLKVKNVDGEIITIPLKRKFVKA